MSDTVVKITQRNQYKPPCRCECYVRMRETVPFCDNPKSPYYLRCPAGPCAEIDHRNRDELLEQRAREQRAREQREAAPFALVTTTMELNELRKRETKPT